MRLIRSSDQGEIVTFSAIKSRYVG